MRDVCGISDGLCALYVGSLWVYILFCHIGTFQLVGGTNFMVYLSAMCELLKLRKEDRPESERGVSFRQLRLCSWNNETKVNFRDVNP